MLNYSICLQLDMNWQIIQQRFSIDLYAYMYVCVCVCVCVCVHILICTCMYVCIYIGIHVRALIITLTDTKLQQKQTRHIYFNKYKGVNPIIQCNFNNDIHPCITSLNQNLAYMGLEISHLHHFIYAPTKEENLRNTQNIQINFECL